MLILSRKPGESIVIDGRICVKVVRVEGDAVKIGIEAPSDIPVHRQEVYQEIQRSNQQALTTRKPSRAGLAISSRPLGATSNASGVAAPVRSAVATPSFTGGPGVSDITFNCPSGAPVVDRPPV